MRIRRETTLLPFAIVAASAGAAVAGESPTQNYATSHWQINVTDFGYSDLLFFTTPPFPDVFPQAQLHEMLSGEWAAAIGYDGIEAWLPPGQVSMWLEPAFVYPDWMTSSNFKVVTPQMTPTDTDGDRLPEGGSTITNGHVTIDITFDMEDTVDGVPMGVRDGEPVMSDRYVLHQRYAITNTSGDTITNLRFYQLMHGHPANTEIGNATAYYDPTAYAGQLEDYRYDATHFAWSSGRTDAEPTGCMFRDHVGFASMTEPTAFGLGHYRGHAPGKPATGLHLAVEQDTLGGETTFGPDETAAAQMWSFPSVAADETVEVEVLLSLESVPEGVPNEVCLEITDDGVDPHIELRKGTCDAGAAAGPYDVVEGSLRQLADGGPVTLLGFVDCLEFQLAVDRRTTSEDVYPCDATFIAVKKSTRPDFGDSTSGEPRIPFFEFCR